MATYAIGDVQGCRRALDDLLERVAYDRARDVLWLVGDLVNRGPDSLGVVRFVRSLGAGAVTVLGNHDLHLLALAAGTRRPRPRDTLDAFLAAEDREDLVRWLRRRPLLHLDPHLGYGMAHAGIPPGWDRATAAACAREVEMVLAGDGWRSLLAGMYGDEPAVWDPALAGPDRSRYVINGLTRMRYCTADDRLVFDDKGPPGTQRPGRLPWFDVPGRAWSGERIVFGHWATLGELPPLAREQGLHHVDSGCVWGGRLTALRLEDRRVFSVDCAGNG